MNINPDDSDLTVARAIADHLLDDYRPRRPYYFLCIAHDKQAPCPVRFDYASKGRVGIKTTKRAEAHAWIMECLLLGLMVFITNNREGSGPGSSIAHAKERARARAA